MTKKKLEQFKKLLSGRLQDLLSEAGKTADSLSDRAKEVYADPADQATSENDQARYLRIRDRESKLIVKIQEAMSRIGNGSYGVCEMCGEDIQEKRLLARPMATLCIECKMEMENEEKRERFTAVRRETLE